MKPSLGALPPAAAADPFYMYGHHAPVPAPHPDPQRQGILTLFVAGLPDDVKPREIHNLFSRRPGFDCCQLEYTGRGNQAVAFVTFFTHQSALAAMNALNGTVFDPETGASLHIELARSNSRKRRGGTGVYRVVDKRVKRADNDDYDDNNDKDDNDIWGEDDDGDGGSDGPSGTENENSSDKHELAADQSGESGLKQEKGQSISNDQSEKSSLVDIPPCSTLFIANLGHTCTEEKLKEAFSKHSGFHVLKMRCKGGMPVAFADFTDIESSTAAMNSLQGTMLASSDGDGLHLEYARSKMRKT